MKWGFIAVLFAVAVMPSMVASLECWKCADSDVLAHRSLVSEIRLSGKWNGCDKPALRECMIGCFEARATFKNGNIGFVRDCATDNVMKQMKWNGTNTIPERETETAHVQGRMCTTSRCNRSLAGPYNLVAFFDNNQAAITIIVLIALICIPISILGCRCFYKKMKTRHDYMSPSEEPITYSAV